MPALGWIIKNTAPFKLNIIALSLLNFITAIISVLYAVCFKEIIDYALNNEIHTAIIYGGVLISFMLLQIITNFVSSYLDELTRTKLGIHLRKNIISKLLNKEYKDISSYHTGEINNRIFSDIGIVTGNSVTIIPSIINMAVRLISAFVVLFFVNAYFSLTFLVIGMLCSGCMLIFRNKMKKLHKDMQYEEGRVRSTIQETVSSSLLIKIFNAHKKRDAELEARHTAYKNAAMKRKLFSSLANAGMNLAYNVGFLLAFFWGIYGIISNFLSYGSLTAILQLTGQIQGSVSGITGIVPSFYSMTASAERLIELLNLPDEEEKTTEISDISEIDIRNVSFAYGNTPVLKNISLNIKNGETTAILGTSGVGKSTLFMLILGIYKPQKGEIKIISSDGKYEYSGFSMRKMFSYVPQNNQLFSGTVKENLTLIKNATEDEINKAIEISCADFIFSLPCGIDTRIGENGFGLSEGQRQRIAIARAILSDAEVILFDEATSALDEETEQQLIKNLGKINRTSLIITHRPSILTICDNAYKMDNNDIKKA